MKKALWFWAVRKRDYEGLLFVSYRREFRWQNWVPVNHYIPDGYYVFDPKWHTIIWL
jgi:hypothetical protein